MTTGERLPEAARLLMCHDGPLTEPPREHEGIARCPACGTCYAYAYDCELGIEAMSVRRATPTEARGTLGEPDYAALVGALGRQLESPHRETRQHAAKSLAHHHLAAGDVEPVLALLRHPDPEVVSLTAGSYLGTWCRDLRPFVPALLELLASDATFELQHAAGPPRTIRVRDNALGAVCRVPESMQPVAKDCADVILASLAQRSADQLTAEAVQLLGAVRELGRDLSTFVPVLRDAAVRGVGARVQTAARELLERCAPVETPPPPASADAEPKRRRTARRRPR